MQARQKILPLTSLRFFAALFVIFFHTTSMVLRENLPVPVTRFLDLGYTSVSFFFTLSGYILAIVYLSKGEVLNRKPFWIARFARIYPLFFLTLLLDTPNLLIYRISTYGIANGIAKTSATFAANLVMLQSWILQLKGIDDPNWSLGVETVFYLIFPFIAYSLWRVSPRATLGFLGSACIAAIAFPWLGTWTHINLDVLKFNPLFHISEFVAGILLARWHTNLLANERTRGILQKFGWLLVLIAAILFGFVAEYKQSVPVAVIHDGLMIPVWALLIVGCASGNRVVERALSAPLLVVLGEASYAMYLLHIPIWHFLIRVHPDPGSELLFAYVVFVIVLSLASFYWFETPTRRLIIKWAGAYRDENVAAVTLTK